MRALPTSALALALGCAAPSGASDEPALDERCRSDPGCAAGQGTCLVPPGCDELVCLCDPPRASEADSNEGSEGCEGCEGPAQAGPILETPPLEALEPAPARLPDPEP